MVQFSAMAHANHKITPGGNPYASLDPHADPVRIPRHSNPLSFLSKRAFAIAALAMMSFAATETAAAAGNDCVCNYDPDVDYFPNKIAPDYSTNFKVEYFKSYKKLTVIDGEDEYVTFAYLCGTPVPILGLVNNTIEIPIKSAAVTSTTLLPFIEYLGERESLHYVSATNNNFKSCVRKLYDEGKIADGTSLTTTKMSLANASAYERTGDALDVVFMDSYNFKYGLRDRLMSTLGPRTKAMYIAEQLETTPLGKLEWVELMAALYNKEHLVLNLVGRLNARYKCVKDLVAASPPAAKKKVLWGYCYYNSWAGTNDCYVAVCPNYYCDLVKDAGAELLVSEDIYMNTTQMHALAAQADVWIYVDANWNRSSQYAPPFFQGDLANEFADLPVVQNKQVYDVLGNHWSDWFDDAKAQPGVVLMDLVQAIYGDLYIDNKLRQRDYLRNVFSERTEDQGERLSSACANTSAPLYTEWDEGFCALPPSTVVVSNPDKVLCMGGSSDATARHDAFPALLLMISIMLAGGMALY